MIDFSPNSTATVYVRLEDDGAPVVGATVLFTVVDPTGTTIIDASYAEERGDGYYSYTLAYTQTAEIGAYFATWHVINPSESVQKTVFTVGYEAAYPVTLLEIRQDVSRLVEGTEGFLTGKVEAVAATLNPPIQRTITDYARMESDQAIRGWKFHCYSGSGAGYGGRVASSNMASYSFVVSPTSASTDGTAVAADSLYELHRHFSVEDLDSYIRLAILEVQDTCLVPISWSQDALASPTTEYSIPAGFSHVHAIDIEVTDGYWVEVVPACWKIIRSVRKIRLDPTVVARYSGCAFRIRGFRPPQVPLIDDQGIDVRPSFVTYRAAAFACESKTLGRASDPEGFSQKMGLFESRAEAERVRIARRLPPNTRRVD